jgi:heme-degrading monooxygenase HmoA
VVLEVAFLFVEKGKEIQFEKDFQIASQYISGIKGYIGHNLQKCMEQEAKYLLQVNWEALEDHTIGFRTSEVYLEWKKLLHHYYNPFPIVEHYQMILENKKIRE